MICDEEFLISALDVPTRTSQSQYRPPLHPTVTYTLDGKGETWFKSINLDHCDRASLSALLAHINFLRRLSSPDKDVGYSTSINLPRQIHLNQSSLILSYKYHSFGSVHDVLQRLNHGLTEEFVAAIFARAVWAVDYLHSRHHMLHRALCSHHLLLTSDHQKRLSISLCGLGSVTRLNDRVPTRRTDLPPVHFAWRGWLTEGLNGHPIAWYSPEMIGQDFTGYSYSADVYSLGLVLGEMITGRTPYFGVEPSVIALRKLCGEPEYPEFYQPGTNELLSEGMLNVYTACVERDPSKRPSSTALLQLPWVRWGLESKFDSDDLESELYAPPPSPHMTVTSDNE